MAGWCLGDAGAVASELTSDVVFSPSKGDDGSRGRTAQVESDAGQPPDVHEGASRQLLGEGAEGAG